MKKTALRLICLLIALAPMTAMAQSNIKAAFDAIINSSDADISASHSLQKDPETKIKSGQDDIYRFVLPAKKMNLIKKALAAFEKDIPEAYSVESGKNTSSGPKILLHSEQTSSGGISIDDPGCDYIYALFLPSKTEDPDGIHRYAYGLNYKEEGDQIRGKLIINYATTLKHRQSGYDQSQFQWRNGYRSTTTTYPNGVIVMQTSDSDSGEQTPIQPFESTVQLQSWFEQIMGCINGMSGVGTQTRIALATKAYGLVSHMNDYQVSEQDKNTARQLFKTLRSDKHYSSDPILAELLRQCELGIK